MDDFTMLQRSFGVPLPTDNQLFRSVQKEQLLFHIESVYKERIYEVMFVYSVYVSVGVWFSWP
jgi:hypothetical protein